MNVNFLYPVVHDLTEAEYNSGGNSGGCCNPVYACNPTGCFSLEDLIYPESEPVSIPMTEPTREVRQTRGGLFGRNRSRSTSRMIPQSLVEDRNDDTVVRDRRLRYDDVYALTKQIHSGRISTIWESVHKTTGNRYATKVFDRRTLTAREDQAALREAACLQQISKDAVGALHLIDFFEDNTHLYLVTDYAAGGDLLNRVVKSGPLNERQAQQLARSMLLGVKEFHDRNICHRKLTPENILLEGARETPAFVADLGSALQIPTDSDGDRFLLTERCATNAFTAPEILQRFPYDTQADMWSIGVVLFFAMAGYKPFDDPSSKVLFQKIVKADYAFSPKEWYGFTRSAKRFISSLLHADPQVRMTVQEALDHPWIADLNNHVEQPMESPKESEARKMKRPKKFPKVWKAFSRVGKRQDGIDEDIQSTTSRTVSVVSSDPPTDPSNKRLRTAHY